MNYFSLEPNEKNLIDALNKDVLSRNKVLLKFLQILDSAESNLTVSLDGAWGSGKTFFVKQAQMILNNSNSIYKQMHSLNESTANVTADYLFEKCSKVGKLKRNHLAVYFDAWANDNAMDPVISIIYRIIEQLDNKHELKNNNKLETIIGDILKAAANFKGLSIDKIMNDLQSGKLISGESERIEIQNAIDSFFDELKYERGDRIDIFIDELDRCRPTFAISVLETIKHYFNHHDITFIFSTNLEELGKTVECNYGTGFNSTRYMDRFFDLRLELKKPDNMYSYLNFIKMDRYSIAEQYGMYYAERLGFELRELNNYLKTIKIALSQFGSNMMNNVNCYVVYGVVAPLLLALKMYRLDDYNKVLSGTGKQLFVDLTASINIPEAHIFYNALLNKNESYVLEIGKDSIMTDQHKKVEVLYESLFPLNQYKGTANRNVIGEVVIDITIIEFLPETLSLLSNMVALGKMN